MSDRELLVEATAAGNVRVIVYAIFCGIMLGILYDGFRVFRTVLGLRRDEPLHFPSVGYVLLVLLDCLYFLIAGAVFSVFLYHRDNGVLRWYSVVGTGMGAAAYLLTVGRAVSYLTRRAASAVQRRIRSMLQKRPKRKKKEEVPCGKKTKRTAKKNQLLHKDRDFRLLRILRHHDFPDGVTDQEL